MKCAAKEKFSFYLCAGHTMGAGNWKFIENGKEISNSTNSEKLNKNWICNFFVQQPKWNESGKTTKPNQPEDPRGETIVAS